MKWERKGRLVMHVEVEESEILSATGVVATSSIRSSIVILGLTSSSVPAYCV